MDFTPITSLALFGAGLVAMLDFIRYAKVRDANGALMIFLAWLGGFGMVALGAQADVTQGLVLIVDQPPLGLLDVWSLVLLGFVIGSIAPTGVKVLKAFDNTDTAKTPMLVSKTPEGE